MTDLCNTLKEITPVNGIVILNSDESKIITKKGYTLLRTGNVETDISLYPNAATFPLNAFYYGTENHNYDNYGLAVDDNYIYSAGPYGGGDRITIFNKVSFNSVDYIDINSEETNAQGVAVDDDYVYMVGSSTDKVWIYNKSTKALYDNFSVGNGEDIPTGMAVDNDYIYVVGSSTDKVWIYDKSNSNDVDNFSVGNGEIYPRGVAVDDDYIYVMGTETDKIWAYDKINYSTINSFDLSPETGAARDLAKDDTYIYVMEDDYIHIYYNPKSVGLITPIYDPESGLPIYIRIK